MAAGGSMAAGGRLLAPAGAEGESPVSPAENPAGTSTGAGVGGSAGGTADCSCEEATDGAGDSADCTVDCCAPSTPETGSADGRTRSLIGSNWSVTPVTTPVR